MLVVSCSSDDWLIASVSLITSFHSRVMICDWTPRKRVSSWLEYLKLAGSLSEISDLFVGMVHFFDPPVFRILQNPPMPFGIILCCLANKIQRASYGREDRDRREGCHSKIFYLREEMGENSPGANLLPDPNRLQLDRAT